MSDLQNDLKGYNNECETLREQRDRMLSVLGEVKTFMEASKTAWKTKEYLNVCAVIGRVKEQIKMWEPADR